MSQVKTRHQAREFALQILYRYDVATGVQPQVSLPQGAELARELSQHFDHFKIEGELRQFVAELVVGTLSNLTEIDALLEKHAANWKISRMSYVDRSLLRMAIFELKERPETPSSVVIDEAIELSKQFGTSESPAFVNGILDAVKGGLRTERPSS